MKHRPVPFPIKEIVNEELDRMIEENTLKPGYIPNWISAIVPIFHIEQKRVRIYKEYSKTVEVLPSLTRELIFSLLDSNQT